MRQSVNRVRRWGVGKLSRRRSAWPVTGLLCMLLTLSGCSEDGASNGSLNDGRGLVLALAPQFAVTVDVKSADASKINEIEDLWVIQLNAAGTAPLVDPVYLTGSPLAASGAQFNVLLEEFKPVASRLYVIANTHDAELYRNVTSEAEILAVQGTDLTPQALKENGVPMSGYAQIASNTNRVSIPLYRAVAKVNFKWKVSLPSGERFYPSKIHLRQVPTSLHYFRDYRNLPDPASSPYPSRPDVTEWATEDISSAITTLGSQFTWYLPENARGTGIAMDAGKTALTAPRGQSDWCTVAIICGTYAFSGSSSRWVSYHFYLGADNAKDYNLLRNHEYNASVTIRGCNDADMQVIVDNVENTWNYASFGTGEQKHNHSQVSDLIYTGRFLIAETDVEGMFTWAEAVHLCPGDWRLPTVKELDLIFCMRDTWERTSNKFYSGPEADYWSVNDVSSNDNAQAYMVRFGVATPTPNYDGGSVRTAAKTEKARVRCIRDL